MNPELVAAISTRRFANHQQPTHALCTAFSTANTPAPNRPQLSTVNRQLQLHLPYVADENHDEDPEIKFTVSTDDPASNQLKQAFLSGAGKKVS